MKHILSLVIIFVFTFAVPVISTVDAKYKQISNGVGNCIFSSEELLYQKESSYSGVKDNFQTGDKPREIRCYFQNKVNDYKSVGKFYNQIRNDGQFYDYFTIESLKTGKTHWEMLGEFSANGEILSWDQLRLKIWTNSGKCNIIDRSNLGKNGCLDVDKQVRALAKKEGASLPYTAKMCVSVYFKYSDNSKLQLTNDQRGIEEKRTGVSAKYMAQGCVKHTAR